MKKFFAIILLAAQALAGRADLVADADSAYMADDFLNAAMLYQTAIDSLGPSAERYYNLGNAYYRSDLLGMAIVSYERALRLDPTNRDIIENLEFVNSRTVDRIEPSSSLVGGAADRLAAKAHPDTWAWVALAAFVLALAGVCVYFFAAGVALRKIGFFGAGVLLVVCVLANVLSYRAAKNVTSDNQAVVTAPSVILSTTPRTPKDRTEEAMLLHEGTKLTILDSIAGGKEKWYDVEVDDSHRAWISADAIEII
jgi:hypothetical protein BACCOPRO_01656